MATARILVASLGIGRYQVLPYRLSSDATSGTWSTAYAPAALARLRAMAGARAFVLVTKEAKTEHYAALAAELDAAGLTPEPLDMPRGQTVEDFSFIVERLANTIPRDSRLTLDVTYSLRHLPFIYFAALAYLAGLRGVEIEGVFYGALDLKDDQGVPLLDLTPLLRLMDWYRAVAVARELGSFRLVERELRGDVSRLFKAGAGDPALTKARDRCRDLAAAATAGLPLELGLAARDLAATLARFAPDAAAPAAPARLAAQELAEAVAGFAVGTTGGKAEIVLTLDELRRQLELARWYHEHGDSPRALLILREWVVSATVFFTGEGARWLDYERTRGPTERLLNGLRDRSQLRLTEGPEQTLAQLWARTADARNGLAHAGMRLDAVDPRPVVASILADCRRLLELPTLGPLPRVEPGPVLLTPLGLSPGVLFSAVIHLRPRSTVIVTSPQARCLAAGALAAAGQPDLACEYVLLEEPHLAFAEARRLASSDDLVGRLARFSEVVVNLTGGTTALQYVVERLADRLSRLAVRVRRTALVDRRGPEEQRSNPYVLGELVPLE